jgi:DNA topoisomerase VI subunit A
MYALVDNDLYGLSIYGVYKYGGGERTSALERKRLALPRLQFLGIRAGDFGGKEGLIALTERDRGKIEVMLEKKWVCDEPEIRYVLL